MSSAMATVRRWIDSTFDAVVVTAVFYAVLYVAGTWIGSGGNQDPWESSGPFAWLWWASLAVVAIGVLYTFVASER